MPTEPQAPQPNANQPLANVNQHEANANQPQANANQPEANANQRKTIITTEPWGKTSAGEAVDRYTLDNGRIRAVITNYGGIVLELCTPDRNGQQADIALGLTTLEAYEAATNPYFGATIGRYANRIAYGRFTLDGVTCQVPQNNGTNALHGGPEGFNRKVWSTEVLADGIQMTLTSPDGDMGFPGTLKVLVRFTLGSTHDQDALTIEYTATTDRATVLNLTNHSYFNLAGESSGTILDQTIHIPADRFTPVTEVLIPTGEFADVTGSPFDLREPTPIGAKIQQDCPQLKIAGGYDHNFIISMKPSSEPQFIAAAADPKSGRTLTVFSTEPGVQFYSGNFLDGSLPSKQGGQYVRNAGFCLETQHFPDSPNQPTFPSTRLQATATFHSITILRFGLLD